MLNREKHGTIQTLVENLNDQLLELLASESDQVSIFAKNELFKRNIQYMREGKPYNLVIKDENETINIS